MYIKQGKCKKKYFFSPTYFFLAFFEAYFGEFSHPTTIAIMSFWELLQLWKSFHSQGNLILTCLHYTFFSESQKMTEIFLPCIAYIEVFDDGFMQPTDNSFPDALYFKKKSYLISFMLYFSGYLSA